MENGEGGGLRTIKITFFSTFIADEPSVNNNKKHRTSSSSLAASTPRAAAAATTAVLVRNDSFQKAIEEGVQIRKDPEAVSVSGTSHAKKKLLVLQK